MPMCCHQHTGQHHYVIISSKSFEKVREVEYLRTTITNQNYIHEEIKSRFTLGIFATIHVRMFCLLSGLTTNIKIKIYKTIILPFFFVWV